MEAQEQIFDMILDKDDISWQSILYELVRNNEIDPWDVEIGQLTNKFLQMLKKLKELDFRIPGKVLVAATMLLKMKSNRLVGEDLDYLDSLFAQKNDVFEEDFSDDLDMLNMQFETASDQEESFNLIPRTPQARRRKVSIYDLIDALQKAMEVKKRRVMRDLPTQEMKTPEKVKDISLIIREVMGRIREYFTNNKNSLKFSTLTPSQSKEDKVFTFIPLLHLTNARKIDLTQQEHFGEIEIELCGEKSEKSEEKV